MSKSLYGLWEQSLAPVPKDHRVILTKTCFIYLFLLRMKNG